VLLKEYKKLRQKYPETDTIPQKVFETWNDRLAKAYKTSKDVRLKQDIIQALYEMDISLFKQWKLFDISRKPDFAQEAFLCVYEGLQKFEPGRGSWIHFLREYFIKGLWRTEQQEHEKAVKECDLSEVLEGGEAGGDPLFLKAVRESMKKSEWKLFERNFFKENSMPEMIKASRKTGKKSSYPGRVSIPNLKRIRKQVFEKCTELKAEAEQNCDTLPGLFFKEKKTVWLDMTEFARKAGYAYSYVRNLVRPHKKSIWRIDPRDLQLKPTPRIRFLETECGWIFPRFKRIKFLGR
jgi:hypothetical protein